MKEKVKQIKFNFVVAALLYIALGVVLLVWPDTSSSIICYTIGTILLIYGVISIIGFLVSREKTAVLAVQLVVGVAAAALGVFSLTQPKTILSVLPVLMGLFIIVVSLISLKRAIDMRHYLYQKWWAALLLAVIAIAVGLLILFHPYMAAEAVIMLMGVGFIYVGVCDLWAIWKTSRLIKEYKKRVPVEVDPIDIQ